MVKCSSTAKEFLFEWSHDRISFMHSKVRTTLHVCIIDPRSERVKSCYILSWLHEPIYWVVLSPTLLASCLVELTRLALACMAGAGSFIGRNFADARERSLHKKVPFAHFPMHASS